ncbi:MAG: TIGR03435 family protein [Acidobacteriota bacterium]
MKALLLAAVLWSGALAQVEAQAAGSFAVASIRPSSEAVKFESDGETRVLPGEVKMRDVTIQTCIKWAYGVQRGQVVGPGLLTSEKYDIEAKADGAATEDEMKGMMRALLTERFGLAFHREKKELRAFALVAAKGGPKLGAGFKQAAGEEMPLRQNSAMGTTARALTMQEFADFLSGPTEKPVVDKTGMMGRWDFAFDFTKYMTDPPKGLDDFLRVLNATLEGEMGLKLESEKDVVEVMVVDTVRKASAN